MKRLNILQAIAAIVFVTGFTACQSQKQIVSEISSVANQQPIPMILDSDFGSSTDDLFALMMLHHYIDEGKVDLKGIIVDREGEKNAAVVDVFNT